MSAVEARRAVAEKLIVVPYSRVSAAAVATNMILILLGCFFLLPMLWMVFASIDSNPDWAIKLPSLTLANFIDVLGRADAISSFRSSLILAGTTTIVTTVLAVLAAYPLSRMHIPFKHAFMLAVLFASGLPVSMLIVPVYQMYVTFGWLDSLYTTALFLAASSLPFAIWLMKNFIDAVPEELDRRREYVSHPARACAAADAARHSGDRDLHVHQRLGCFHHPLRADLQPGKPTGPGRDLQLHGFAWAFQVR